MVRQKAWANQNNTKEMNKVENPHYSFSNFYKV